MFAVLLLLNLHSGLANHHDPAVLKETYDDDWVGAAPYNAFSSQQQYSLEQRLNKQLEFGDKVEVWGRYKAGTGKFNVNLVTDGREIPLHIDFRPWGGHTIVNSLKSGVGWQTHIVCPLPAFVTGKEFKVSILCTENGYKIKVNDKDFCKTFPYRIPISKVTQVSLNDEYRKYVSWIDIKIPIPKELAAAIKHLEVEIKNEVGASSTVQGVKEYATSEAGSLHILQWNCLKEIENQGKSIDLKDRYIWWVFNSAEAMENLMLSGDIDGDKYKEAIELIAKIIKEDENAKTGLKLKLATAIGITFSTPVHSMAVYANTIDGIARYHKFADWADKKLFMDPFYNLNTWQIRYVVGSWAEDEELEWARQNVYKAFKSPDKIGDAGGHMVAYKLYNDDGISVHDPGYYYYKPVTMAWIHKIGGVCGAISKFSSHMAQAHGIPAMPVGQPGHCAFIWLKNGNKWSLGNDISGWEKSVTHTGIQWTWKSASPFIPLMATAQNNTVNYRISERLRKLVYFTPNSIKFEILNAASVICPQNYDSRHALIGSLNDPSLKRTSIEGVLKDVLLMTETERKKEKNIALSKPVEVSFNPSSAYKLNDGLGTEWFSKQKTAWLVIDLEVESTVNKVTVNWWGQSRSRSYDVLAAGDNGNYQVVRTTADETLTSTFNGYSILDGWKFKTRKIKFNLREGIMDYWGVGAYFGIREVAVNGIEGRNVQNLAFKKPISPEGATDLVDGNVNTRWSCTTNPCFIDIDLQKMCLIDRVILRWTNGIQGSQRISYTLEGRSTVEKSGRFSTVELSGIGSKVKVEFTGSSRYELHSIEVWGTPYSVKDILKMRVNLDFEGPDEGKPTIRRSLYARIDEVGCKNVLC